jgi:ferredoxin
VDLYAVLAVGPDASTAEIHEAWKRLQKAVHPDVAGAYVATASSLLNEAKTVLGSKHDRAAFDLDRTEWLRRGGTDDEMFSVWNAEPLSAWSGPRGASTDGLKNDSTLHVDTSFAAFVDESRCIGCVQCATAAPNTFRIETRFGRARVVDQWADGPDAVADAVEICPVRCIHFVDPLLDLPILERVSGRLWKERGDGPGGISAKRGGGDASPFEVVDALRRRADLKTGLAPWPSRRRRASVPSNVGPKRYHDAGADVDTSSAAAAVAAAVRAANAAEAAAAETSDWRAGSFEEPSMDEDDDANEARGDTSLVFVQSPDVSASAFASAPGSPGPSGFSSRDAANNVVGFETGSNSETSKREVERLHALLRDAHASIRDSGTESNGIADGSSTAGGLDEAFDASDLFWKAPDEKTRARDGGGAFEASEDGDFAPSEWIAKVRRSRGRTLGADKHKSPPSSSEGFSRTRSRTIAHDANATRREKEDSQKQKTLPRPLALLATALFLAALGTAAATPTDVKVVVAGTESGVSETGGWVGQTSRTVVVEVGSPTQTQSGNNIARSRWSEFACAAVAWYAALGFFAEIASHAAANTTRERR